jgi:hypothetical protein
MSEETKEAAQTTHQHLQQAEVSVRRAEESAKQTGDKKLHQQVTKIKETVEQTRKDLGSKISEGK